jgi:hypothetical protein
MLGLAAQPNVRQSLAQCAFLSVCGPIVPYLVRVTCCACGGDQESSPPLFQSLVGVLFIIEVVDAQIAETIVGLPPITRIV